VLDDDAVTVCEWEAHVTPRRWGLVLTSLSPADGRQRVVSCDACAQPIAYVDNLILSGLVNARLLCGCGRETILVVQDGAP